MDFENTFTYDNPIYAELRDVSRRVSNACLSGNRIGDAIKEKVRLFLHMTHTSDFIHGIAHKCLEYLDEFADILHSANLEQEYPTTEAFIERIDTLDDAFGKFYEALTAIKTELYAFIGKAETATNKAMAIKAEDILEDVDDDVAKVVAAWNQWHCDGSEMSFDKWVASYFETEDDD